MDGGTDCVAGSGTLCSRQAFCRRPHLTDTDHIGMLTQNPLQEEVLVNVQSRIFAGPCQQMNDGVQDITVFVPLDQIKLAAAFLDGNETLVVRYIGEQPRHDGRLSGAGRAGNAHADTIPDTGHQEMKHLSCSAAGVQQFLLADRLLVDDTNGGVDTNIRVYNGRLVHRDTDVFVQKAHHTGHGVVNDHAAGVEHTAHHINGVLRGGKLVRDLDAAPAGLDHFDVVVGVDVDFLNAGLVDPFLEEGVPGHILIELFTQFLGGQPFDGVFPLDNVLHHQLFEQCGGPLGVALAGLGNGGGVIFSKIPLHILQHLVIGQVLVGRRREEYVVEIIHRRHPPRTRPRRPHPLPPARPAPSAPKRPAPC